MGWGFIISGLFTLLLLCIYGHQTFFENVQPKKNMLNVCSPLDKTFIYMLLLRLYKRRLDKAKEKK